MEGRIDVSDAPRVHLKVTAARTETARSGLRSGTLENWTVEGDAFAVVSRPALQNRRIDRRRAGRIRSEHGGWERVGARCRPRRTATARPTRLPDRGRCLRQLPGGAGHRRRQQSDLHDLRREPRMLRPAVVECVWPRRTRRLRARAGRRDGGATAVYLKESPWAHVNFDNFRFHASKPSISERDHRPRRRPCHQSIRCRTRASHQKRPHPEDPRRIPPRSLQRPSRTSSGRMPSHSTTAAGYG